MNDYLARYAIVVLYSTLWFYIGYRFGRRHGWHACYDFFLRLGSVIEKKTLDELKNRMEKLKIKN